MRRGEIWTVQDKNYASKARPVVIVQNDNCDEFDSLILCLFTTFDSREINTRVLIKPTKENGLMKDSFVMTDKIVTVAKSNLGSKIGVLSDDDMAVVSEKLKIILGL